MDHGLHRIDESVNAETTSMHLLIYMPSEKRGMSRRMSDIREGFIASALAMRCGDNRL